MDLKNMLLPEKSVVFDFPGCEGLTFELAFLSKDSNRELYKKCQKTKIDSRTRQPSEEFDDDLFMKLYVKSVVKNWEGFKLKYLRELVLAEVPEEQENELLPYSDENAIELMKNSSVFDTWVTGVLSDLGNFTKSSSKKKSEK